MNVLKHMEAIFVVVALLAGVSTWASAESYKAQVRADALVAESTGKMATVKVSGKRLVPVTRLG